jgi:small subunit ribosomal protein S1
MNDEKTKVYKKTGVDEGSFAAMLESSLATQGKIPMGEKVQARIFKVGKDYLFLDLGSRDEGILPRMELEVDGKLTVEEGDVLTVLTIQYRDGAVLCASRLGVAGSIDRPGDKDAALNAIRDAYESGMPVEANVKETVKGGFTITLMGQRAFCPISQIDNSFCDTPEEHVGHTYAFLIIEFDDRGRNIVVSRRRLLDQESEERARHIWDEIQEGDTFEGVVKNIMSYGAFVDIGGLEGLLHVSEISHDRVDDPNDVLEKGQSLQVSVKKIDREKKRISLSAKMLQEDPWIEVSQEIKEGAILEGQVTRIAQFGAFVEIRHGVEGLVHISEMGHGKRLNTPREAVEIGETVSVKVLSVDSNSRRISLSINDAASEEEESEETERKREFKARNLSGQSFGTLGDLLGSHLKK